MISGSLSRRYARAFLSIAAEEGQLDPCGEALRKISASLTVAKGVLEALSDRSFQLSERLKALEEILEKVSAPALVRNFLFLLVEKGRINFLPDIAREFGRMQDEQSGIMRVEVLAATEPTKEALGSIEKILGQRVGKKVIASGREEKGLIGGMVLKVGHLIYDGSIRRELQRIQEKMEGV